MGSLATYGFIVTYGLVCCASTAIFAITTGSSMPQQKQSPGSAFIGHGLALIGNLYPVPEVPYGSCHTSTWHTWPQPFCGFCSTRTRIPPRARYLPMISRFGLSAPRFLFFIFLGEGALIPSARKDRILQEPLVKAFIPGILLLLHEVLNAIAYLPTKSLSIIVEMLLKKLTDRGLHAPSRSCWQGKDTRGGSPMEVWSLCNETRQILGKGHNTLVQKAPV